MKKRESETVEFKKTTSELKEGVISLASMLNKSGTGALYFGVKNDGTISGLEIGQSTTSDIARAIKEHLKPAVIPSIEIINEDDKQIIYVKAQGTDTPYSAYGRYYIRLDDEDLVMTNDQLEAFFLGKSYDYSKWEKEVTEFGPDDVDEDLLIRYVDQGNECGRIGFRYRDADTTLRKLELLNADRLNNAGYYLFSNRRPLLLKLATYPTDSRISFSDMKQFRGNIFECIEEAVKYVTNNIRWSAEIRGMKRVESPEIPLEAFREIIVNSFAHMKVSLSSSNEIYITPSRVHIYNPGPLVPGTDPKMFANGTQSSMIRNPLIATVLYYNGTIDAFGTGFERVFRLCGEDSCRYSNNQFGFTFEFIRTSSQVNYQINEPAGILMKETPMLYLSDAEKAVLAVLSKEQRYNKTEIGAIVGKSPSTVQRAIKSLTDRGLVRRIGANKDGYWVAE
ncbi:MAG: putative DNA binding domain-containing protein [Lachnospiraceae bacterium]|nr:putative DNA binding domain-containing protein [Lachnospiraceae bacterium]